MTIQKQVVDLANRGYNVQEIADKLDIDEQNVKGRLKKAKDRGEVEDY